MSTVLNGAASLPLAETRPLPEEAVRGQVWSLLTGFYPANRHGERRADQRFPYPHLVQLTPVGPDGTTPLLGYAAVVVAGKDLSERGLGFYHPQPLPFRRMIASLRGPANESVHFLIDITWCRFTGQGWYDSGGRFLRTVADPRAVAQ